jgi:hypothetical protein
MRFHALNMKCIGHASRRIDAASGNGCHFNKSQAPNSLPDEHVP